VNTLIVGRLDRAFVRPRTVIPYGSGGVLLCTAANMAGPYAHTGVSGEEAEFSLLLSGRYRTRNGETATVRHHR
jgi:hypothetical protein